MVFLAPGISINIEVNHTSEAEREEERGEKKNV